ncbi:MAG: exosortase family protein XrtF [Flavobacteriaceae bacterium]
MKKYFITYRPFLRFLLVFFVSYGVLSFVYNQYLSLYENQTYPVDPVTEHISHQVKYISNLLGGQTEIYKFEGEKWTRLFFIDRYVARIVEGCNAVSVMILFASFVIAFAGNFKKTLLFILSGVVFIHILNVFRIAALSYFLYYHPQYNHLIHGVLFPLVIYGFVFVLWIVWVKKYSGFIPKKINETP